MRRASSSTQPCRAPSSRPLCRVARSRRSRRLSPVGRGTRRAGRTGGSRTRASPTRGTCASRSPRRARRRSRASSTPASSAHDDLARRARPARGRVRAGEGVPDDAERRDRRRADARDARRRRDRRPLGQPATEEPPAATRSKGVSGGNPFAQMIGVSFASTPLFDQELQAFATFLRARPEGMRVINYSATLGPPKAPRSRPSSRTRRADQAPPTTTSAS